MDATQRSCTVLAAQGEHMVQIGVMFPSHYPNGAAPSFLIDKTTSIDISSQQDLHRVRYSLKAGYSRVCVYFSFLPLHAQSLTDIALNHVKLNRPCLEPCLRRLSKYMESLGVCVYNCICVRIDTSQLSCPGSSG